MSSISSTAGPEAMHGHGPSPSPAARRGSAASGPALACDLTASGGSRPMSSMPPPPRPGPRRHLHSLSSSPTLSHPSPMPHHARSMSHADAASRQSKRLSLHFPLQPAAASTSAIPTPRSRPASWFGASPLTPSLSPGAAPASSSPPPDGNFFTALAAQERRVLELKEELAKAEERLKDLKKQWANQEAGRRGGKEGYGFHPLQPLNTGLATIGLVDDDPDGPSWMQKEMERRRAILHGQRHHSRKVFSGSKHTRTLSLLSPTKHSSDASFTPPLELPSDHSPGSSPSRGRSSTTPDITTAQENAEREDQRELLLRTGKQMASDFKDGLWTFIEDLRQATVGDEAINGTSPQPRRQPSGSKTAGSSCTGLGRSKSMGHARKPRTLQPSGDGSALIDIETDFWKEHGIDAPRPPKPAVVKSTNKTPQQAGQNFDESWDDWDTPSEKYAPGHSSTNSSISEARTSPPSSERSSPRTSTSSVAALEMAKAAARANKRISSGSTAGAVPWHALNKLSPSNIKRTASNFMDEWEKSIGNSPTDGSVSAEADALQDYYISLTPTKPSKAG